MGGTKNYWLTSGGCTLSKLMVKRFYNVDWAGQLHQHSILGYLFHISQGMVIWSSKKQYIIMLSNTESEYISLVHTTKEGCWLRTFLSEIQNCQDESMEIDCDNQGATALSEDNKFHQWISTTIIFMRLWKMGRSRWNTYLLTRTLYPWWIQVHTIPIYLQYDMKPTVPLVPMGDLHNMRLTTTNHILILLATQLPQCSNQIPGTAGMGTV